MPWHGRSREIARRALFSPRRAAARPPPPFHGSVCALGGKTSFRGNIWWQQAGRGDEAEEDSPNMVAIRVRFRSPGRARGWGQQTRRHSKCARRDEGGRGRGLTTRVRKDPPSCRFASRPSQVAAAGMGVPALPGAVWIRARGGSSGSNGDQGSRAGQPGGWRGAAGRRPPTGPAIVEGPSPRPRPAQAGPGRTQGEAEPRAGPFVLSLPAPRATTRKQAHKHFVAVAKIDKICCCCPARRPGHPESVLGYKTWPGGTSPPLDPGGHTESGEGSALR